MNFPERDVKAYQDEFGCINKFPPLFATINAKEWNTLKEESIDTN